MAFFSHIDKKTLFSVIALCAFGFIAMFSASPAIASRINISKFYILNRHVVFVAMSILIMIFISKIDSDILIKISFFASIIMIFLLFAVLFAGQDIKGSKRWIKLTLVPSIQPSEIFKPFFIATNAMFLCNIKKNPDFKLYTSIAFFSITAILLIREPDFGMFFLYFGTWMSQVFVSNIRTKSIIKISIIGIVALIMSVLMLSHAKDRIRSFLGGGDKASKYQVEKALQSIIEGGVLGKGLGEGNVKYQVPDVHTDYIFAVIGEEMGYIICLIVICIYFYIAIHNTLKARLESSTLKKNVIVGSMVMFSMQSFLNIGVSINMLPSKGTIMPFISYGGSATISYGLLFGILMSVTSKNKNEYKINIS